MGNSNDQTDHYLGVLLEDMDTKLDAILEGQQAMVKVPSRLDSIEERLGDVEGDVKTIKAAVKDQGRELRSLGL